MFQWFRKSTPVQKIPHISLMPKQIGIMMLLEYFLTKLSWNPASLIPNKTEKTWLMYTTCLLNWEHLHNQALHKDFERTGADCLFKLHKGQGELLRVQFMNCTYVRTFLKDMYPYFTEIKFTYIYNNYLLTNAIYNKNASLVIFWLFLQEYFKPRTYLRDQNISSMAMV